MEIKKVATNTTEFERWGVRVQSEVMESCIYNLKGAGRVKLKEINHLQKGILINKNNMVNALDLFKYTDIQGLYRAESHLDALGDSRRCPRI